MTKKEIWTGIGITLGFIALIAGILWVSFGAKVASSGIIGQGDAIIQKNSAENWTKAQAEFEELYAGIEAADRNIVVAYEAYDRDPSQFNETNYTGAQMTCQDLIGQYNSKARTFLAADFKAADLPDRIDQSLPATDCKE
jgi:hypothetical protein